MKFKDIKIGERFTHNGTVWTKKSTRTAYISKTRFFYFSKEEEINPAIVVDDNYYGAWGYKMYKLITRDGDLYFTTQKEAVNMQKYLGGKIVSIH